MEILVEIKKLQLWCKNSFLKEIPLLMLTDQNKALFMILINQNKDWCIKIKQRLEVRVKACFRDNSKAHYLNIQLIKKKFDSNIDGQVKELSWNNEACCFIIFKVIIKNYPRKNIKDHISARKAAITYKNFEVFLKNWTHS